MDNIRFNYLYRDAGNYKRWGSVIFSNPDRLAPDAVTKALQTVFPQERLFGANQIRIPERFLFARGEATSDDHCFHEFDAIDLTSEPSDDVHSRSATAFVEEVRTEAARGWIVFDPHDRLVAQSRPNRASYRAKGLNQ